MADKLPELMSQVVNALVNCSSTQSLLAVNLKLIGSLEVGLADFSKIPLNFYEFQIIMKKLLYKFVADTLSQFLE